jgi:hypothetical protein
MVLQKSPLIVALKLLVAAHTHMAEIKRKFSQAVSQCRFSVWNLRTQRRASGSYKLATH